jgi:hypothetical protein
MAHKTKGKNSKGFLAGFYENGKGSYKGTALETGLTLAAGIAAGFVGAALGKHSFVAGIPVTAIGIHKKNIYLTAAGLGLALSNGFQNAGQTDQQPAASTEGVDGIKEITDQAKERVGNFLQNFKQKLYLSPTPQPQAVMGLGENEQVTYFVNPYTGTGDLDMSAIDRLQEQIAQMNKPGTSGLDEPEREF